ncbi:hypothetical protein HYH02_012396 [Chlamydomonas schloesseri]|uniref:Argonaute-like protein n=1 Tax=Chlamydomonas schloesseri TaxID=2026947 RepID=A0A835W220_9CHLO|nr:hypothetical protein HYH02_012396 [Chlamydomonas schloesseri]|eukprot:KAG2434383.1 hypothetical protein HYH02_012396 [Chlamydomonas schloesseri]
MNEATVRAEAEEVAAVVAAAAGVGTAEEEAPAAVAAGARGGTEAAEALAEAAGAVEEAVDTRAVAAVAVVATAAAVAVVEVGGGGGGGGVVSPQAAAASLEAVLKSARTLTARVNVETTADGRPLGITRRPNAGTVGRAVQLLANYFALATTPAFPGQAYHYDVEIRSAAEAAAAGGGGGGGGARGGARGGGRGGARGGGRGGRGALAPAPASPEDMPGGTAPASGGGGDAGGEDLPPRLAHRVMAAAAAAHGWPAGAWRYDGRKNLYLPGQALPREAREWPVTLPAREGDRSDKGKGFVVTTKWAAVVDLTRLQAYIRTSTPPQQQQQQTQAQQGAPRDAMQVLDVVVRHAFAVDPRCTLAGRGFYYRDEGVVALGGGAELWSGFQQSFKAVQAGMSLNLDSAFAAFMSARPLPELLAEGAGLRGGPGQLATADPRRLRAAARSLVGFKVEFPMPGGRPRRKVLTGLSEAGADRTMFFNDQEGREMSVADYFRSTGRPLRQPGLPCANVGDRRRAVYIPIELCTVVAGQRRMKLDASQSANMITAAKQDPGVKAEACGKQARRVAEALAGAGTERCWGLKLGTGMLPLTGRVLPNPMLQYGDQKAFDAGPLGSWNTLNVKFAEARPLDSWAVVVMMSRQDVDFDGDNSLWQFLEDLCSAMITRGMRVASPVVAGSEEAPPVEYGGSGGGGGGGRGGGAPRGVEATMRAAADAAAARYKKPAQLVLVVLPEKPCDEYREVKRVSDMELGIPSQVVVAGKARIGYRAHKGGGPQYCANVAMKINNKLGGVNVMLSGGLRYMPVLGGAGAVPFMVMGADVTHPTGAAARADARDPSVAAVVASLDQSLGRWASRVLLQAGRQEVISGMGGAAKELLLEFYRANRQTKPQRLVMYRDGVSEGQFEQVLAEEYTALRRACSELEAGYRPAITFVVVQKRHNTRLLPADRAASDPKGNVVPGTVVDAGITAPDGFDFYLNSHAGLQGTNKPAHYHVLVDEIGFGADGIQLLTYWLCYLYQRTTKSVSYCPPAYYADRAAFRGRTLLAAASSASDSASESGGGRGPGPAGGAAGAASAPPTFAGIHRNLSNLLYFM